MFQGRGQRLLQDPFTLPEQGVRAQASDLVIQISNEQSPRPGMGQLNIFELRVIL